jgi:hypothetical protein
VLLQSGEIPRVDCSRRRVIISRAPICEDIVWVSRIPAKHLFENARQLWHHNCLTIPLRPAIWQYLHMNFPLRQEDAPPKSFVAPLQSLVHIRPRPQVPGIISGVGRYPALSLSIARHLLVKFSFRPARNDGVARVHPHNMPVVPTPVMSLPQHNVSPLEPGNLQLWSQCAFTF